MNAAALKERLEEAKCRLQTAEEQMAGALHEIGAAPRAEKTIISAALSTAFAELKAARQALTDLEQVIAHED